MPSVYILRDQTVGTTPVTVEPAWADELAGTAFIEDQPMDGYVIALSLSGPTTVGVTEIKNNGTWRITGIAQKYAGEDLIVLGVPRNGSVNVAIASRVRTV